MREDIQRALNKFEVKTFGNKKNISAAEELLHADETVLFASPTNIVVTYTNIQKKEWLPGVVFLTNKRLVFHFKALSSFSTEIVPLDEIRSLNSSGNGLTGGHVEVHTMTKTFDILVSYKKEIIQKVQKVFEAASNIASVQPVVVGVSDADELVKFKKLFDDGIITSAEFKEKKRQIIGK